MRKIVTESGMKENELVISSYGRHPFELKRASTALNEDNGTKRTRFTMAARLTENLKQEWDADGAPLTEAKKEVDQATNSNGSDAFAPYRKFIKPS